MSFSLSKFIKGLRISKENVVNPSNIDILPGGTAGTTTTMQAAQTANRTLTLPDETGTVLSTASTIDLDQLESVTASRALVSNGSGKISAATTTAIEIGYVNGVTSAIQTQINTVSGNLSTETAARIAGDASLESSKADVDLSNILPVTAIDINGQKITNSAAPTVGSDLTNKTYVDAAVTGGGANLTLSNLNTTSINQDLLPNAANTRSVGSASLRWANLFVSTIQNASASVIDAVNSRLVSGATTKLDWSGTDVSLNTRKLTDVSDPSSAQDAATKNYVDTTVSANVIMAPPSSQRFTSGSGTYNKNYTFIISSGSATVGATYTNNAITYTVSQTVASATQVVMSGSGAPSASGTLTKASGTGDATLTFSQVKAPLYLKVKMSGGGGGGHAGNDNNSGSSNGGSTTFGSSLLTCTGGTAGGGAPGTATVNSPAISLIEIQGETGNSSDQVANASGGAGGTNPFAGGGRGGIAVSGAGLSAVVNTGAGGGGGASNGATAGGTGGSAGGYLEAIIPAPVSATYAFAIGAGGNGATATGNGGAGGSGIVIVEEHYQ